MSISSQTLLVDRFTLVFLTFNDFTENSSFKCQLEVHMHKTITINKNNNIKTFQATPLSIGTFSKENKLS